MPWQEHIMTWLLIHSVSAIQLPPKDGIQNELEPKHMLVEWTTYLTKSLPIEYPNNADSSPSILEREEISNRVAAQLSGY